MYVPATRSKGMKLYKDLLSMYLPIRKVRTSIKGKVINQERWVPSAYQMWKRAVVTAHFLALTVSPAQLQKRVTFLA